MMNQTILVVDDDEDVAYMMATMLNILGYHADHARSGKEALTYCMATPPALVLLDLDMPVLDGFQTIRLLRGYTRLADLPIVAFTGSSDEMTRARTREAGFCGYLQKPVPMDVLVELIEQCIPAGARAA
jgi:CheY-like chemotaxis protein